MVYKTHCLLDKDTTIPNISYKDLIAVLRELIEERKAELVICRKSQGTPPSLYEMLISITVKMCN